MKRTEFASVPVPEQHPLATLAHFRLVRCCLRPFRACFIIIHISASASFGCMQCELSVNILVPMPRLHRSEASGKHHRSSIQPLISDVSCPYCLFDESISKDRIYHNLLEFVAGETGFCCTQLICSTG
jgi:hypothetical protein